MKELSDYCIKWNLTDPEKIAKTLTSDVYRVKYQDNYAVLKMLSSFGQKHEALSPCVLKCFNGNGAAEVLEFDDCAHLIEFIDGPHLKSLVENGDDGRATEITCDVLNKLHNYSGPVPSQVIHLKAHFRALFAISNVKSSDPIFSAGAKVAEQLLETQQDVVMLHGDIHHKNILNSSKRGWLAIDPQCVLGERTFDIANSFFNPDDMSSLVESETRIRSMCNIFSKRMGLGTTRILEFAFAYGCLSSAWCIEDGQSPDRRLRISSILQRLLAEDSGK